MVTKYRSRKTMMDGIVFDSRAEAGYYLFLKSEKQAGRIKDFELQPKYLLQSGYRIGRRREQAIHYIADFLVTYPDGRKEVIDVKGVHTPVYRLKKKLFEKKYGIGITEVKV